MDDLAEAEDDDDDDDDVHRYDAYFDIRVKRRMVRSSVCRRCSLFLILFCFHQRTCFLFLFCFHERTILVEYNLEKFVSVKERYVAGESRPVE